MDVFLLFLKNNRLKQIELVINGKSYLVEIPDEMKEIIYDLPEYIDIKSLVIRIRAVYKKQLWDDTPISGIQFYTDNLLITIVPSKLLSEYWRK